MLEWTVKATYPTATPHGVALVDAHFLVEARDAATAEAQAACLTFNARRVIPDGATITAYRRYM